MNKKGFTLAEVLITLGVIGVVAAMTLPTLIKNYQKHVWVNQLKTTVSILQNAIKQMMLDDGVEDFTQTSFVELCTPDLSGSDVRDNDKCSEIMNKYFKVADVTVSSIGGYNNGSLYCPYVSQGLAYYMDDTKTECPNFSRSSMPIYTLNNGIRILPKYMIDVNGTKGPNTLGRDIFALSVKNNGIVVGVGYPNQEKLDKECKNAQDKANSLCSKDSNSSRCQRERDKAEEKCSRTVESITKEYADSCPKQRSYCALRIMYNGWKMDY